MFRGFVVLQIGHRNSVKPSVDPDPNYYSLNVCPYLHLFASMNTMFLRTQRRTTRYFVLSGESSMQQFFVP